MPPPSRSVEAVEDVDCPENGWGLKDAPANDEDVNCEGNYGDEGTYVASQCTDTSPKQGEPFEELIQNKMANNTSTGDAVEGYNFHESGADGFNDRTDLMLGESELFSTDLLETSTATLRPEPIRSQMEMGALESRPLSISTSFQCSASKTASESPPAATSGTPQNGISLYSAERSPTRSDSCFDEKRSTSEDEREVESGEEIQNIMDQFSGDDGGPGIEEVMSPRLELASPLLGNPVQHPPRKSSLEPLNPSINKAVQGVGDLRLSSPAPSYQSRDVGDRPILPQKPNSIHSFGSSRKADAGVEAPMSPTGNTLHRPPPPEPEPEPDLPFDFHRFLEQLRHRTADPVAKFLRSFLLEFGKKQWMVHEQVKIISDFLAFIANKMAQCEVWREVSDAEFDNAREGMEKLVMNRLYTQTFSPAIPPVQAGLGSKSRRGNAERQTRPGRRGQHQEDVERDDILGQKIRIYGWIKEEHLDIPPVGESGRRFLVLAQQELLKIKTYRAPRDKIICVLNCCKVIFGLLKHSKTDSSADSFMPLLIYVVLQSNPEHLVSNVQYILRFRNQEKLAGEAGYYLSSLMGAVQFIENLDRTTLTISDEEFERNVEAAVSEIAEKPQIKGVESNPGQLSEKPSSSRPDRLPRPTFNGESSTPKRSTAPHNVTDDGDGAEEKAAMSGLLRTIQRPLSSIGRIFTDEGSPIQGGPIRTPQPGSTPRASPAPRSSNDRTRSPQKNLPVVSKEENNTDRFSAEEAAARQASAETAEAYRIQRAEHANIVETLAGMFPDLDRDVISDVVIQKNGRVGLAVDACLALST